MTSERNPSIWLHTQLSLLRNLEAFVFTAAMTTEQSEQLAAQMEMAIRRHTDTRVNGLKRISCAERFKQKQLMLRGMIWVDPLKMHLTQNLYWHEGGTHALIVNDMDHLRMMQFGDSSFESAWQQLDLLDDALSQVTSYAYDDHLGYLTSKVEHLGTGLVAEAILHLPVLHRTGYIQTLSESAGGIGIAIKPWQGAFYKLSNLVTLGRTELEIALLMDQAANMLAQRELAGRETLWSSQQDSLLDQLGRSYGLAKYCTQADAKEAIQWFSDLLLAEHLGLTTGQNSHRTSYYEALCQLTEEGIDESVGKNLRQHERSKQRAKLMNTMVREMNWRG